MISSSRLLLALSACLSSAPDAAAFAPQLGHIISRPAVQHDGVAITSFHAPTAISMAGFGGGAASSKKNKKKKGGAAKLPKLKAKSQWDRYADLKGCTKYTVGVRIVGEEEWMEVGRVRSANDEYTEASVARQRALIAEHGKRLYPVQIPANAVLEWGYMDGEEWVKVDKSKGDDIPEAPSGIERKMGFEGISDEATGFYCYYHEGRIVAREEEGKGKKSSVV